LHTNQVTPAAKKAREKIVEGNQRFASVVKPIGERAIRIQFTSLQTAKINLLMGFLKPLAI